MDLVVSSISSEVGMHLLGGKALFLSSDDIQLGTNETLKVLQVPGR